MGSPLKSNSISSSLPCNRESSSCSEARRRRRRCTLLRDAHESAGVVVADGGGVAEGLEQRAGGGEARAGAPPRARLLARHHDALQAHARRLRLAGAALACNSATPAAVSWRRLAGAGSGSGSRPTLTCDHDALALVPVAHPAVRGGRQGVPAMQCEHSSF